jgi:hypothetical protein
LIEDDISGVQEEHMEFLALECPELDGEPVSHVARAVDPPTRADRRKLQLAGAVGADRPGTGSLANESDGCGESDGGRRLVLAFFPGA